MNNDDLIPLSRPDVTDNEIDAIVSVLKTDRLSLGPHLKAFEDAVAHRAGRKYGIGVNSGTSGLHLCVRSLGIGFGDEVITTPFSFIATTNAVLFERAKPVFVDVDPVSYNLDPTRVEAAITPRTKAILAVETFGNTAHFDQYEVLARKNGLKMIEDSCEALGGFLGKRPAGSFGECSIFGFYPNKQITSGEGGVIVTDDEEIRDMCCALRNQGRAMEKGLLHEHMGYNYRLNEVSAVMGEVQMTRLNEILHKRRGVAEMYNKSLREVTEVICPPCIDPENASWFVYVIRLADRYHAEARNSLMERLRKAGLGCERYFYPIHLQPFIRKQFGFQGGEFPICERIAERTVALPFFTQMSQEQVTSVVERLKTSLVGLEKVQASIPAEIPKSKTTETPSSKRQIPFYRVTCEGRELRYVAEVLESGWLTTASKTLELERRFAKIVGSKYACAVNSCTAALHLALEAVGIKAGDTVLVPTMTFTASAEVVRYLGAEPVLLDVEYGTSLLTPEIVEDGLNKYPNTKAVVVVHFGGHPAAMIRKNGKGILDICHERGVAVIEDAAHSFPARLDGRMIGSFGDATCFSFYANKTITSGEGGMLTTNSDAIARRASIMRLHGIDRDVWDRFSSTAAHWEYDVVAPGYKYNMPDINAAVGLAQLERADDLFDRRYACVEYYYKRLSKIACLDLPLCHVPVNDHSWHLFVVILKDNAPIGRDEFIVKLAELGIGTSVHYKPLHRMTYYKDRYKLTPDRFPNAERIWKGCVSLPVFPAMTDEDLDYVCTAVEQILK